MNPRKIKEGIYLLGALDWERRCFDSLIPLPDGTSYNSYLINGTEKTVLIDTVDPSFNSVLLNQLEETRKIDYVISLHAEQDHSGTLNAVLEKYPAAKIICSKQGKIILTRHLDFPVDRIHVMLDGETLDIGGRTLEFIYTPWAHWPETMCTYLMQDNLLFTGDLFASHLASSDVFGSDESKVIDGAKRYYAEVMMPFRKIIQRNMRKIMDLKIDVIAPAHGPLYRHPALVMDAYNDWLSDKPKNIALVMYVTMHGSTKLMVDHLVSELMDRNVGVAQFDLSVSDIGKYACSLVDAATLVIATPIMRVGPHPLVVSAVYMANILRAKAPHAAFMASYGWGNRLVEILGNLMHNIQPHVFKPILSKGLPRDKIFSQITVLAESISEKHKECCGIY